MVSCCEVMLQKDSFFKINFICFHYYFCAVLHSITIFVRLLIEIILKVHLYAKRKISDILDFRNAYNRGSSRVCMIRKISSYFILFLGLEKGL